MGKEEFAQILEGMINDSEMAEKVAGGDFSVLAEGELTESERALLSAAGGELDDDVSGFGIDAYIKLGDIDGESRYTEVEWTYAKTPNVRSALGYLKIGDIEGI